MVSRHVTGYGTPADGFYSPTNIKLYSVTGVPTLYVEYPSGSEYAPTDYALNGSTLNSSFGTWNPVASSIIQSKSIDVKSLISANNSLTLKLTGGTFPYVSHADIIDCSIAKMELVVIGYKK